MRIINIHEAKTTLSQLLNLVHVGQEFVIAKAGKPIARLMPIEATPQRKPGALKGKIQITDDFDSPSIKQVTNVLFA